MLFMQGNTQGPCSLEQLIFWLDLLKHEKAYQEEYEDFKEVSVWIVSSSQALETVELVCMHVLNVMQHRQDIMASFWQAVSLLISYAFCTLWLGNCMQRQASLSDLVKFALQHKFVYNITAPCMQAC